MALAPAIPVEDRSPAEAEALAEQVRRVVASGCAALEREMSGGGEAGHGAVLA